MNIDLYIIGSGTMAEKFAEKALCIKEICLKGMIIRKEKKIKYFTGKFPGLQVFKDQDELEAGVNLKNVLIIVATPPDTHYEICSRLLDKGCHILCEKPLGINLSQARELADKAVKSGIVHACCESRLLNYQPLILAKDHIDKGMLGRIYYIEQKGINTLCRPGIEYQPHSKWYLDKKKAGGGPFLDWGVYDLAILNKVCKDITEINLKHVFIKNNLVPALDSIPLQDQVEEHGLAVSEIKTITGECFTYVHERANVCHGTQRLEMRICGEKGGIEMNWFIIEPGFTFFTYDKQFGTQQITHKINHNYDFDTYPLENIANAIINNVKPDTDFCDAAKHIEYVENIYSLCK